MSTWVIISWVFVAILTAINIGVFLKLKQASEQMMKMAFPNAKNMNDALSQMQAMMGGMQGMGRPGGRAGISGNPYANPRGGFQARPAGKPRNSEDQLKAAMDMLKNMQKGKK